MQRCFSSSLGKPLYTLPYFYSKLHHVQCPGVTLVKEQIIRIGGEDMLLEIMTHMENEIYAKLFINLRGMDEW